MEHMYFFNSWKVEDILSFGGVDALEEIEKMTEEVENFDADEVADELHEIEVKALMGDL